MTDTVTITLGDSVHSVPVPPKWNGQLQIIINVRDGQIAKSSRAHLRRVFFTGPDQQIAVLTGLADGG